MISSYFGTLSMTQSPNTTARLVAILQVEKEARVQCQEPGCAHGVYRAIDVVGENGKLTVLGSTCFAKRFGGANALGKAKFGGGSGRLLTPSERELLRGNTAALLDLLEKEQQMHAQIMQDKVRALHAAFHNRKPLVESSPGPHRVDAQRFGIPWIWAKPFSSIAYFPMRDGTAWVRVQHRGGEHLLMPWPAFEGWDEALPSSVGVADPELGGLRVHDLAESVKYLKAKARFMRVGIWREVIGASKTEK